MMMKTTLTSKVLQAVANRSTGARCMSSTAKVWVDKHTKVICQGFTGKQVRQSCFDSLILATSIIFLQRRHVWRPSHFEAVSCCVA